MSKQMIFRVAKNRDNPYVMINKKILENKELSFRAKGVLGYILTKPDTWKVCIRDIVNNGKEGRDAVYSGIKELIQLGYIQHVCCRENGKITHYEYIVYEEPLNLAIESTTIHPKVLTSTKSLHTGITPASEYPDTESPNEGKTLLNPLPSENPETEQTLAPLSIGVPPENPDTEIPTQVINDFNNKLINNKSSSSRARCTISDLWQEIFQDKLTEQEYHTLLKASRSTTIVRNLCLIEEHHTIPSILSPFSFVMKCVTSGGYKVPSKVRSYESSERKRSKPLPKSVQAQREGRLLTPAMSHEEFARRKAELERKIRMLAEPIVCPKKNNDDYAETVF